MRKEGIATMMKYAENANLYTNRAWRTVHSSRIDYIHVQTPHVENDNNNDYKQFKSQKGK